MLKIEYISITIDCGCYHVAIIHEEKINDDYGTIRVNGNPELRKEGKLFGYLQKTEALTYANKLSKKYNVPVDKELM